MTAFQTVTPDESAKADVSYNQGLNISQSVTVMDSTGQTVYKIQLTSPPVANLRSKHAITDPSNWAIQYMMLLNNVM